MCRGESFKFITCFRKAIKCKKKVGVCLAKPWLLVFISLPPLESEARAPWEANAMLVVVTLSSQGSRANQEAEDLAQKSLSWQGFP